MTAERPKSLGRWRSRPVFVSSTFRDMHAERDWLYQRVFPRIEEKLRERRHHLEPIDLRLGVGTSKTSDDGEQELLVLKVCLDEIQRSRPFLIVLLGDRYGWQLPSERIHEAAGRHGLVLSSEMQRHERTSKPRLGWWQKILHHRQPPEQGLTPVTAGMSVTALEIKFGLLREIPHQQYRCLIFLRQPLPFEEMTPAQRAHYSDAWSTDPKIRAGYTVLQQLKDELRNDPQLAPRVFEYAVEWDSTAGRVIGLGAFGDLVFEQLWKELDQETSAFADQPPLSWEEQEHITLAEFIEHRALGFVGRDHLLEELERLAREKGDPITPSSQGTCIVGGPGAGKSALFAELHRRLSSDSLLLVLANSAGGTIRGASVDAMLRRWVHKLAIDIGIPNPLPAAASMLEVEEAFYALLVRRAKDRRVVLLLDALDQMEPTTRGQHLTWLRTGSLPPDARLIAMAQPGVPATVLQQRLDKENIRLPPLTVGDEEEIGRRVWRRHHREIDPGILDVLTRKSLPSGALAAENPLWLTLALEELMP